MIKLILKLLGYERCSCCYKYDKLRYGLCRKCNEDGDKLYGW